MELFERICRDVREASSCPPNHLRPAAEDDGVPLRERDKNIFRRNPRAFDHPLVLIRSKGFLRRAPPTPRLPWRQQAVRLEAQHALGSV